MPRSSNIAGVLTPVRFSDVLKHLGTIKNELLIFVILVIIISDAFGFALLQTSTDWPARLCGVFLVGSTVPMVFLFGTFYVYAVLRLPGTQQELVFAEGAQRAIKEHSRAQKKPGPASIG